MTDPETLNQQIADAIVALDPDRAAQATRRALEGGLDVMAIIEMGISAGMTRVGLRYQADEFHMPELLYAEEVMRQCLQALDDAAEETQSSGVTKEAEARLLELSRSWVGNLSSCVTRLFRYDEERRKAAQS